MRFDLIPSLTERPADAAPTQLRVDGEPPARRTVLRALTLGALTATLVPFDWVLAKRSAAAGGPTTEHTTCTPIDPDYDAQANNWPGGGVAACIGGRRRGKHGCSSADYHRQGYYTAGGFRYSSYRTDDYCAGRNAWRWRTGSYYFRCSDAITTAYTDHGNVDWRGLTVARCSLRD